MSIEKKSLISTLKTTKKANAVSSELSAKPTTVTSKRAPVGMKRAVAPKRASLKRAALKRAVAPKRASLKRAALTKRAVVD